MTTGDETLTAIDRRVQRQWRIEVLLVTAPLAIVATSLSFVLSYPPWLVGLTVLAGMTLPATALALVSVRYRHWRYALREDSLVLQHGVWFRQRSVTPYYRVQNVDLTAGPLERWLGLQRLTIKTASSSTDATIPGLDKQDAKNLAERILLRAGRDAAV
ncbi:MAG: PH domain-containing protein [Acidimicrobiaceae bacterium]|nr:PH domain-containing protein [Acidimicrobiaceae bacterium]